MKKFEDLGKTLSKNEMKSLTGGLTCHVETDCPDACVTHPLDVKGQICNQVLGGVCQKVNCP